MEGQQKLLAPAVLHDECQSVRYLNDVSTGCQQADKHFTVLVGAASVLQGLSDSSQMVSAALQEYQGAIAGAAAEPAQAAALTLGDVGCSYQQSPTYDDNTPQAMAEAGADLAAVNGAPALTEPSEIRQRSLRAKRKRGDSDTAEGRTDQTDCTGMDALVGGQSRLKLELSPLPT